MPTGNQSTRCETVLTGGGWSKGVWRRFVRFGFRLLYNELAFTYDSVSWLVSLGQWHAWQRAALPFVKGPKVLEIAPGTGHMMQALAEGGHQVYGLDLSPYMVQIATNRMTRNRSKAKIVQGQSENLPFADDTFTTILVTFPSEFIFAAETLQGVWRGLEDGGSCIIVLGAQLGGKGITSKLIRWLYYITGQNTYPDEMYVKTLLRNRFPEQLDDMEFNFHFHQIPVHGSLVTIVILGKRTGAKD